MSLRPPNILYLHSHDTGRMIEPYGFAVRSPNLSRFARSAAVFRQAFTVNPTCSPSRAALLTGRYAHHCGMLGLAHFGFKMPDYNLHLAHVLQTRGYLTALAGVQHETCDPETIASYYEENLNLTMPGLSNEYFEMDRSVVHRATAFLKQQYDRPFFLSVGFSATHRRFPHSADCGDSLRPWPGFPDSPEVRQDMADYQKSLDILDECMGSVLGVLDETGLSRDTIVICTTDHGPAFPRMKCTLRDDGLGVMLMLRIPEREFSGRKVIDAMVTHLDIFPTLMELLDMEAPHALDGQSLLPLFEGKREKLHETVFSETNFHVAAEPQRAVRTERWKYIRRFVPGPAPLLNIDDSSTKDFFRKAGLLPATPASEELYDLLSDPSESCNVASREETGPVLESLRVQLANWMKATGDPLLAGPLELPPALN